MSREFEEARNQTDEVFVVFLPTEMLNRLRERDSTAIQQAQEMLGGVVIYDHIFSLSPDDDWSPVSLGELEFLGAIGSVTLNIGIP